MAENSDLKSFGRILKNTFDLVGKYQFSRIINLIDLFMTA